MNCVRSEVLHSATSLEKSSLSSEYFPFLLSVPPRLVPLPRYVALPFLFLPPPSLRLPPDQPIPAGRMCHRLPLWPLRFWALSEWVGHLLGPPSLLSLSFSLSLSASCSWSCCLTHASWIHSHAQTQKSRDSLRHTGSGSILNHNQIRFKISSLLLWHAADRVDKVEFELSFSDLFSSRSLFPPVDWRWTCVRQGVRETEEEGSGWSLHSY